MLSTFEYLMIEFQRDGRHFLSYIFKHYRIAVKATTFFIYIFSAWKMKQRCEFNADAAHHDSRRPRQSPSFEPRRTVYYITRFDSFWYEIEKNCSAAKRLFTFSSPHRAPLSLCQTTCQSNIVQLHRAILNLLIAQFLIDLISIVLDNEWQFYAREKTLRRLSSIKHKFLAQLL